MKAVIIYIIFFSILHVSSFAQHNQYTSTKFAVKNPYEVFIGGIMKGMMLTMYINFLMCQ